MAVSSAASVITAAPAGDTMGRSVSDPGMGQAMGGSQRALEHEPPAAVDFVPGTAKRCVRHRPFGPLGQIVSSVCASRCQKLRGLAAPCAVPGGLSAGMTRIEVSPVLHYVGLNCTRAHINSRRSGTVLIKAA